MSKIEVNTIDAVSGTSTLTLGSSNASTIALGSGDVQSNMLYPAFIATNNTQTSMSGDTWTTYIFDGEVVDTDSAFNTSTYKFVVPSGKAGMYLFTADVSWSTSPDGTLMSIGITKNGTRFVVQQEDLGSTQSLNMSVTGITNCSVGDEIYAVLRHAHSGNTENTGTGQFFSGFRIGT